MTDLALHLRTEHKNLDLHDVLKQPVSALLGVSAAASEALGSIGVQTVFDLGSSWIFAKAAAVVAASEDGDASLPSGLLKPESASDALATVADLPLESLRDLSEEIATALKQSLDVASIREFAFWPPRRVAHRLVGDAAGSDLADVEDVDAEKLRPRLGEYPTERVYYKQLVMFGVQQDAVGLTPLNGALTLAPLVNNPAGFGQPAVGAIVTHSQSWYAQGVTLGHMLHSLALAPGEATRIAVVDWSRRTRATASESVEEAESLDVATEHARAISEVQNAVATEMQEGGSFSSGWSRSKSKGTTYSGSIGGGIAGTIGKATGVLGFGAGGAKASQESETEGFAESTSWSTGTRAVMAEMSQNINDRTQQHSTSVRNRRATAVREVSQAEHERISTRVVANYNHMHALTIQYYEVVQVYRVQSQHHDAHRVIFLPFELMDFQGQKGLETIDRFRGSLIAAALTSRVRSLLIDEVGRVEVRAATPVELPTLLAPLGSLVLNAASAAAVTTATTTNVPAATTGDSAGDSRTNTRLVRTVMRPGQTVGSIPGDALLLAASFENVNVNRVTFEQRDVPASSSTFEVPTGTAEVQIPGGIPFRDVQRIRIGQVNANESTGTVRLTLEADGVTSTLEVAFELAANTNLQTIAFLAADTADRTSELVEHLHANRAYYTRAVLQRLDSASLVMLLTGLSWQGKALVDQIEPRPLAVAGNYLVLRAPVEPDADSGLGSTSWETLLADRGIGGSEDTRLVPIPTGGVFAEAVLGRSNSAEKLDITRFWNWQDSPIPLMPSEIAPIAAGSRAQAENLTPGQVGSVLNVVNPTALPDPSGLSASLGVLANSNLFRDMSGLAGTQATLGSMSSGTLSAATEAGKLASENLKTTTNQAIEMGKAAADMWKAINGAKASASGSKSGGTASEQGAKINHGRDMDKRGLPGTKAQPTGGSPGTPPSPQMTPQGGTSTGTPTSTSGDFMPGIEGFSRELAYSDDSALGLSPAAFDVTAGTLMAPAGPVAASVTSAIKPFNSGNYGPIAIWGEPHTQVLDDAIAHVRGTLSPDLQSWLDKVAFCIARVSPGDNTTVLGGRHEELMLYSASLIKLVILFASFELRERVNAIAPSVTASSSSDFLAQIRSLLQPSISNSMPLIRGRAQRVSFGTVLEPSIAADGSVTVDFTAKYREQLTKIFTTQKNPPATHCIQQLGLSYINGALANGGFFDSSTRKGIWLGGDYAGGFNGVTVKTDDGLSSGQATTAESMMRLVAGMMTGGLINSQASSDMLGILADVDFMGTIQGATFSFDIPKAKVGIGSGGKVLFSEAGVARKGGGSFAYCWQNVNDALPLEPIYRVIERALDNWPI